MSNINHRKLLEWECRPTPKLPKVLKWLSDENNHFNIKQPEILWEALLIVSVNVVKNNLAFQYLWIVAEYEQAAKNWDACTV